MPPKKNGADSLDDPTLLDGEDVVDDAVDTVDDAAVEARAAPDKPAPKGEDKGDDIEVVIEEETEADVRAREAKDEKPDDGALDGRTKGDEEDDRTEYSAKVRERIAREQRIAREARVRAETAHKARVSAEQRAIGREKEALETTKAALELQISTVKEQLVKATDDGKTKEQVDLQQKLNQLASRVDRIGEAQRDLDAEEVKLKEGAQAAAANPLADDWKRRNTWFGNPRYREASAITAVIDKSLANEGFDKNSPEYFDELDRRIRRRIPEVAKLQGGQRGQQPRREQQEKPKEPTGGVRRAGSGDDASPARRGKVVLKRSDLDNMVNFGLDPKDPEHQKQYAREVVLAGGKS